VSVIGLDGEWQCPCVIGRPCFDGAVAVRRQVHSQGSTRVSSDGLVPAPGECAVQMDGRMRRMHRADTVESDHVSQE
jgi:hypothetical protein